MNPVTILTAAVSGIAGVGGLSDQLGSVAAIGLGVGVSLFALTKGWHLLRRFVS